MCADVITQQCALLSAHEARMYTGRDVHFTKWSDDSLRKNVLFYGNFMWWNGDDEVEKETGHLAKYFIILFLGTHCVALCDIWLICMSIGHHHFQIRKLSERFFCHRLYDIRTLLGVDKQMCTHARTHTHPKIH